MRNNKDSAEYYWTAAKFAVLVLLPVLAVWLNRAKFFYPTAQWDGWALDAVASINSGTFAVQPYLPHTPLYLYLLALSQKLGGDVVVNARLFGYACWLLTGWLTFRLARLFSEAESESSAGLIAALLFFTSPLSVQGPLLLDLGDTSLAPLAAAAYYCLLSCGGIRLRTGLAAMLVFAFNLWVKLIHPLFLAVAAFSDALLHRDEPAPRRGLFVIAGGIALFTLTWTAYSYSSLNPPDRWAPVWYFFSEMMFNFHRQDLGGAFLDVAVSKAGNIFRVALWTWLPLLLWGWRILRRGLGTGSIRYLNYYLILFFAVSLATKGVSNGFPKYHSLLMPLLCAFGGAFAAEELAGLEWRRMLSRAAPVGGAVFLLVLLTGDLFLTFNYGLKVALISGSGLMAPALLLALQLLVPTAGFAASWFFTRAAMPSILAAGLAWQAGVGLLQARGEYFTTYGYGTQGKTDTVSWLTGRKGGKVLGPDEFEWELRSSGVPFVRVSDFCINDRDCVLNVLRDPGTGFFVFGQASNTVRQVKSFLALSETDLGRSFNAFKIGDFWVYSLGERR